MDDMAVQQHGGDYGGDLDDMAPEKHPGCYDRLNAAMMNSGLYNGQIVSLVGRFVRTSSAGANTATEMEVIDFQTADQGIIQVHIAPGSNVDDINTFMDYNNGPPFELVGSVVDSTTLEVRTIKYTVENCDI